MRMEKIRERPGDPKWVLRDSPISKGFQRYTNPKMTAKALNMIVENNDPNEIART
jgi:hypothetical protein